VKPESVVVVDYGMGNLASIVNMLRKIGTQATISGDPDVIEKASRLILPGVGAFDSAMRRIQTGGLREVLDHKALREKTPIIGLCLGMQLLTNGSEEGSEAGLGWVPGHATKFSNKDYPEIRIPHMGWNTAHRVREDELTAGFDADPRFYFVHSYYVTCDEPADVVLTARHGVEFHAALHRDNIFGVQFHPEKSHHFGMTLLSGFLSVPGPAGAVA
jgi:glutamine amidotransferase